MWRLELWVGEGVAGRPQLPRRTGEAGTGHIHDSQTWQEIFPGPQNSSPLLGMLPWGWCQHQACHPQALGTCQPPVYQTCQPPVTAWPRRRQWGRDGRWWRCGSNRRLRQLRNKRKPSRTKGVWNPPPSLPPPESSSPHCVHTGAPRATSDQNGFRPKNLSFVLTAQSLLWQLPEGRGPQQAAGDPPSE